MPVYQIPYVDALMKELDRPKLTTSSGSKAFYYRLKHRSSEDAAFRDTLAGYMSPTLVQLNDPETNAIFFFDAPSAVSDVQEALQVMDVPTPQIRMDMTIYEVNLLNDGTLGLDFHAWKNGPGRSLFAVGAFAQSESTRVSGAGAVPLFDTGMGTSGLPGHNLSNSGANVAVLYEAPSAFFDFLVTKGKAQVKAQASLNVLHNNTATLQSTDSILFFAVEDAAGKDLGVNANAIAAAPKGGYRTDNNVLDPASGQSTNVPKNRSVVGTISTRKDLGGPQMTAQDTGIFVQVTPTIGTELINMAVVVRILNHVGLADNERPIIVRRTLDTHVKAKDGQEVVLGGMVHETVLNTTRKVPVLGSIPVIGYLFGGEIKQTQKRLVVLVIKPSVNIPGNLAYAREIQNYPGAPVVVTPGVTTGFPGVTEEDSELIEKAKGEKPIKIPDLKVEYRGDPPK